MIAVVQRVLRSSVTVDGELISEIGQGVNVLLGIYKGDTEAQADFLAHKIAGLRIFCDADGKMNRSMFDLRAEGIDAKALIVSQFTLCGECVKGFRPSYVNAEEPVRAKQLYEYFTKKVEEEGIPCANGIFQADMKVEIMNDGPVTIILNK